MKVILLEHTKLSNAIIGARTCYDSISKSDTNLSEPTDMLGEKDIGLLKKLVHRWKHESVIEHIVYVFKVEGISRACLQQLARHRISSFSVQSTRYCLKRILKNETDDVFVKTGNEFVDRRNFENIEELKEILKNNIENDKLKYAIPEAIKTELVWTINARSLRNFFKLRLGHGAMWEIIKLAKYIYEQLPDEHKNVLFEDFKQDIENIKLGGKENVKG